MNEQTNLLDPDELHISELDTIKAGSKLAKHSKQTPKHCSRSHNSINDRATTKTRIIAMARIFKKEILFTSIVIFVLFIILNTTETSNPSNHTYNKPFTNVKIDTRRSELRTSEQKSVQKTKINAIQNTNKIDVKPLIIYNRVGKCGSRSLLLTISEAVHLKYFDLTFISSPHNTQTYIKDYRQQLELIELLLVSTPEKPTFFSRHINYLNFSDQPNDSSQNSMFPVEIWNREVIYINMIRNPVDRFVSHFYFREYGDAGGGKGSSYQLENPSTVDECFEEEGKFCPDNVDFRGYFYIIPFFCGHEKFCLGRSQIDRRLALQQAKKNLGEYKVVGLLEEFDLTLELLKIELPEYFEHAVELWEADKNKEHSKLEKSKTMNKVPPSNATMGTIAQYMPEELEFYRLVRTRFENHVIKHGLQHKLKHPIGYLDDLYGKYKKYFDEAVDFNADRTGASTVSPSDDTNFFDLEKTG